MGKVLLFTQLKTQSYRSLSCGCLTYLFFFFTTFSKWKFFKGKDLTSLCYLNLSQVIINKKFLNQDTNNCLILFFAEYQCMMLTNHYFNCFINVILDMDLNFSLQFLYFIFQNLLYSIMKLLGIEICEKNKWI